MDHTMRWALDALKAHGIAYHAAQKSGGIVAPPDYWHIHELSGYAAWAANSVGEVERSWLTATPPWVHFKNICYHIRAAEALGFHAVLLITGHYGPNWNDLKTLTELVQPYTRARLYSLPDKEANKPGFDGDGKRSGDHAGKVETSLLWAVEPGCVDTSRFPDPAEPRPHFAMGKDAREADRRIGERHGRRRGPMVGRKSEIPPECIWGRRPRKPVPDLRGRRIVLGTGSRTRPRRFPDHATELGFPGKRACT